MSITAFRNTSDGRGRIARRKDDRPTRRLRTDASRACTELRAANAALQHALDIERFEATRLAQEIAGLRRALRLAERKLDPR